LSEDNPEATFYDVSQIGLGVFFAPTEERIKAIFELVDHFIILALNPILT